jgi:type IV secretory pathway VirJ component
MSTDRNVRSTGGRISSAGGHYTRNIPTENDPFNNRVMSFRDGDLESLENNPETASAATIRAFGEMFARNDAKTVTQRQNADAFLAQHSEFIDHPANADKMNKALSAMYGERVYTVEEFECAYNALRANKALEIDQAEVVKQQQAAANAAKRAKAVATKANVEPTIEDMYSMPLDELRMRAAVADEARKRKIAEEGGW